GYHYFREPGLMPMRVSDWIPVISETLPERPDAKRARFIEHYGITDMHARSLTSKIMLADFFEGVCAEGVDPKIAATWTADVFLGELNYRDLAISSYDGKRIGFIHAKDPEVENSFKVPDMVELVTLFAEGKVSDRAAVEVIRTILDGTEEKTPTQIIEEKGLFKAEDDLVTKAVAEAIAENGAAVQDYLGGMEKSLNFLVGQVMKKTKGTADAKTARELIVKELKG
ncbi:MAG: Asp-tRNA(Asn)/Glu-tRNA(Gln) amidotransferase GatCAB subunit B, partial [Methanosarcina sp.]|nr:Asp-tRNA(Asn)/Glu-tRNA(Gln) amidotransferase GatCAB subunit B [Methanosarcina sp.]